MEKTLRIDERDNVAVALEDLEPGTPLLDGVAAAELIPRKQKAALQALEEGDAARMYGVTVGRATRPVPAGGLLTTENLAHASDGFSAAGRRPAPEWEAPDVARWRGSRFHGYRRSNGRYGVANYWVVVPMVFCENRNVGTLRQAVLGALGYDHSDPYRRLARRLADRARGGASDDELLGLEMDERADAAERLFPGVDGVKFLSHGLGCGGTRDDADALCALLAGYIAHPNVAGATVLSLGCQNAQVSKLEEEIAKRDPGFDRPLRVFTQQKSLSEKAMLSEAMKRLFVDLRRAGELAREPAPLSELALGMECGGSDGLSGISANPAIGRVADIAVALGGRAILSEFPELCGVEQNLLARCADDATAARFEALMREYSARAAEVGASFEMNPSPGNIADGLITDAIKSAGAARKGGSSPVADVLDYAEPATKPGLSLLRTPGNDVESTTAMAGSGATMLLFSTGLGTPTGNPICPTLKISSNTELARRMGDLIDFDAGPIVEGKASVEETGDALFEMVLEVASGKRLPKATALGQDDFLPWKRGVSL